MKKMNNIFKIILAALALVTFFSCDNPLALGPMLDINGPVITITSPEQRKTVPDNFYLTGTAYDKSGVKKLEIKTEKNNITFPRQWRYENGEWQVSDNYGASWSSYSNASWTGDNKSGLWSVNIDMNLGGLTKVEEGEYTFSVQAWDIADFTDADSFKAVVLIVDLTAPKADVSYPYLYRDKKEGVATTSALTIEPFKSLHLIDDNNTSKKEFEDPQYLGKFLTQEFELKWQVDDSNDVYSIDLRFYKHDAAGIDEDPETPLPEDTYIYKFNKNVGKPPVDVKPGDFIKPNGTVIVPDLGGPTGTFDQDGRLRTSLNVKTTIKVVVACYDAAGLVNQEKTLGYFIFWPRANNPWITFTEGMKDPPTANQTITQTFEDGTFTTYPSKNIKATAYQAHGVKKVEYSVWEVNVTGVSETSKGTINVPLTLKEVNATVEGKNYAFHDTRTIENKPYSEGKYTNIFAWDFLVPPRTGYYVVKAKAFSSKDVSCLEYTKLFMIKDVTFPDFPTPPKPTASEPLFLEMGTTGTSFTIRGQVSDAMGMSSLCLVWINPEARESAANAQLVYFRESNHKGWQQAKTLTANGLSALEDNVNYGPIFDVDNPNRLWKLDLTAATPAIDPVSNRKVYNFSKTINLSELNINVNNLSKGPYLTSQQFLLRAENQLNKCTIITYAPQGDTLAPKIKIDNVTIRAKGAITGDAKATCYPNVYTVLPAFDDNDTITITGKWLEDSVKSATNLDLEKFFKNNFEINVNNVEMKHLSNQPALTVSRAPSTDSDGTWDGTWQIITTVKTTAGAGEVPLGNIKDTLVIDATTKDIGGNVVEIGSSWLIKSDKLQLMRISSEKNDDIYGTGEQIEIFLEFSKPVKLNPNFNGTKENIELILSSRNGTEARAKYKTGQNDQNSRQYFVYTVGSGDNTSTPEYLNVKGLCYNNTEYTPSTSYAANNYPFAWTRGSGDSFEEVRITMASGKTGEFDEAGGVKTPYYVRTLPTNTTTSHSDYQYTLFAAKHIKIDTAPPTIIGVSTTTSSGYYNSGDIYFTIKFSEQVKLGTGTQTKATPRFSLRLNSNTTSMTSDNADDVRVNGDSITFKYTIKGTDTSRGDQVYVSANVDTFTGNIYDIAGNPLSTDMGTSGNRFNTMSSTERTLPGVYIEAQSPGVPTVRVLSSKNIYTRTNTTNNTYTLNNHGLADNTVIYVNGSTTKYYVRNPAIDTIQIAAASGGNTYLNLGNTIYVFTTENDAFSQNVSGTTRYGLSTYTPNPANDINRNLSNIYEEKLYLAIQGNTTGENTTTPYKCDIIEYSIDDGKNWLRAPNYAGTPFELERSGKYEIIARQIDKAVNESNSSSVINFTWDPGPLLSRISSTNANGVYTNNTGRNEIALTLYFRKRLYFTTSETVPTLTLNATNSSNAQINRTNGKILVTQYQNPTVNESSITFTYTVQDGEKTPVTVPPTYLDITALGDVTAWDGTAVGNGVNVSSLITLPATTKKLDSTKQFTVETGPLTLGTLTFRGDSGTEGTDNYHGINPDDGSYWTTLEIPYNHELTKGKGNITITQIEGFGATAYRLPTVLTETQYNRFRNIANINTYYVKGTNGYKYTSAADQGSDTTTKYILQYNYNPNTGLTNAAFTGDTLIKSTTQGTNFATALRNAEAISINVNSQAVTLSEDKKTIYIRLTGSSAPQVPGATYAVNLPAGFVTDSLGNTSVSVSRNVDLSGVAKPFVRIKKTQDTITTGTASNKAPRLVATQPLESYARMDCRTPNSAITYRATTYTNHDNNNVTGNNFSVTTGPTDKTNNAVRPTAVDNNNGTSYNNGQITLGNNNYQGYQWWVRTRAAVTIDGTTYYSNGNSNNRNNRESEEKAYRTVITYQLRNGTNAITGDSNQSIMASGDQVWIRGGDAISSSSVPGFPFTWEDNWNSEDSNYWQNKRAGIRLMSLDSLPGNDFTFTRDNTTFTSNGHGLANNTVIYVNGSDTLYYVRNSQTNTIQIATTSGGSDYQTFSNAASISVSTKTLNNSVWKFVSWDINTTAYIDFIRGRDTATAETVNGISYSSSSADQAWQYGPKRLFYQRDGWTAFKDQYPVYPGQHRWCDVGQNQKKGAINFSATAHSRPNLSVNYDSTRLNRN